MYKIKYFCLLAVFVVVGAACSLNVNDPKPGPQSNESKPSGNLSAASEANSKTAKQAEPSGRKPADSCSRLQLAGKRLITAQTFPVDFTPFEESCFATFGSSDEMLYPNDVPRGSTFHIVRDGRTIFDFPDAFGGQSGCWATGVAFGDLNGDGLIDVAIAGSCLGAKNTYASNAVFVNTGSEFTTDDGANTMLEEMTTAKQIQSFVKKNADTFFRQ